MKRFTQNWQTNWERRLSKYTHVLVITGVVGLLGSWLLTDSHAATIDTLKTPETGIDTAGKIGIALFLLASSVLLLAAFVALRAKSRRK